MQFVPFVGRVFIHFVALLQRFAQNEIHNRFLCAENIIISHFVHIGIDDCRVFSQFRWYAILHPAKNYYESICECEQDDGE